jgi:hypothetical protein
MSWYHTQDGNGSMQVQLVEVDRRLPVDAGIGAPERDLSGPRVDQPPVFAAGLAGHRAGDLLQVKDAQVKHHARIIPSSPTPAPKQRNARRHQRSIAGARQARMFMQPDAPVTVSIMRCEASSWTRT